MHLAKFMTVFSSLVWRLLTRYGRIKYRYLLPVYRLLRLTSSEAKATGTAHASRTLRGAQALVRALNRSDRSFYREQLGAVINRVQASKGAVIFLPSVGWEIVNIQRFHHLAREFARLGYVSIFDSSNAYDDVNGFKEIEPNLFLFRADEQLLREIPNPILWAFPYNFDRKDCYHPSTRTVYDWIDDFGIFSYDRHFLESNHNRALKEATVVASVSRLLHEQALAARSDALYLPNGVEYGLFSDESILTPDDADIARLLREAKPIAGYYGAMAEWFDYEMLDAVARLRPDWNFLLIGPMYDLTLRQRGRQLIKRPNVCWIGSRAYRSLPAYLRLLDVAMIPFLINNITLAASPLKLYEYFAGGKPVISTRIPECEAFSEVCVVDDAEQFSRMLDVARYQGQDKQFAERLQMLARRNSWAARAQSLISHLDKLADVRDGLSSVSQDQDSGVAALQYT